MRMWLRVSGIEGKKFVRARLSAGAQMLANMYLTAWIESEKMPEPYKPEAPAKPSSPGALKVKVN